MFSFSIYFYYNQVKELNYINMKTNVSIKKIVFTALFAALAFVATVVIHIHIPVPGSVGYVNLGDCMVLLSGIVLGPIYGGLAAGIGSALADALYGYWIYVPATFVIKMLMAVVAYYIYIMLAKEKEGYKILPLSAAGVVGEIVMVVGYLLYETVLYTFPTAVLGVVSNCMQGIAGIIVFVLITQVIKKTKLFTMLK